MYIHVWIDSYSAACVSHSLCQWQLIIREDTQPPVRNIRTVESESCHMVHWPQVYTGLISSYVSAWGASCGAVRFVDHMII